MTIEKLCKTATIWELARLCSFTRLEVRIILSKKTAKIVFAKWIKKWYSFKSILVCINPQRQKLFKWIKLESNSWSHMKAHSYYIMKTTNFLKNHCDKAGLWQSLFLYFYSWARWLFLANHYIIPIQFLSLNTQWEKLVPKVGLPSTDMYQWNNVTLHELFMITYYSL